MELVWFQGHKWVRESLKLMKFCYFLGNVRRLTVYITWHPEIELWAEHEKPPLCHKLYLTETLTNSITY
jgi:ATP-dependent DNA helicase RecG